MRRGGNVPGLPDFPALAQDRTCAITSALPCRCEGFGVSACDRAPTLPAGNGHKPANSQPAAQSHRVTMCRDITIEIETVKPDYAETNQFQKSRLVVIRRKTCVTSNLTSRRGTWLTIRSKEMPLDPDKYVIGPVVGRHYVSGEDPIKSMMELAVRALEAREWFALNGPSDALSCPFHATSVKK